MCNNSLAESTAMGTMAMPALLAGLGLLLGAPAERYGRVLVSFVSVIATQTVSPPPLFRYDYHATGSSSVHPSCTLQDFSFSFPSH